MSLLLNCQGLSKSFGSRTLFNHISISFDDQERTGLIGPNGAGKSTFLKIIAGLETQDDGTIETRRNLRLGYLAQQDVFPADATVWQVVADAIDPGGSNDSARSVAASVLLSKMGFEAIDTPAAALSGGWQKRLSLARALIQEPDLLLLDEPTNHLDLAGILWLEQFLLAARFSFVLCSHDRYFLQNVTNRIVDLDRRYADGYLSVKGPYSEFLERREGYLEAQQARETAVASRVRREIEWLKRGAKARTTKAKGRIEQAGEMMEDLAALRQRNAVGRKVEIEFTASQRQTRKLLTMKDVERRIDGRTLFSHLNLVLSPGMKLGLLGPNGSGKSTLIRLMTGQTTPDAGEVWRAPDLKIVHFDQKRASLDPAQTVRRALAPGGDNFVYRGQSLHVTAWARKFLFRTEQLDLRVGELSGGEQARLLIADLVARPADVLILDEPTNDLDIASLEVLEESLSEFPGALVLVTHDRFMIDRLCTGILALDGKGAAAHFVDLAQWEEARHRKAEQRAEGKSSVSTPATASETTRKKLTWNEQRELEQMETNILLAEERLRECQQQLENPEVLKDHVRMREACVAMDAAQRNVAGLYERWEALEAKKN